MKKLVSIFVILIFLLSGLFIGTGLVLFFTTSGAELLTRIVGRRYLAPAIMTWEKSSGDLAQGVCFDNVYLENVKSITVSSQIKIQKICFKFNVVNRQVEELRVDLARFFLPVGDPIVLTGQYAKGILDFNIYANEIGVGAVIKILALDLPFNVSGMVKNGDIFVRGPLEQPRCEGTFEVGKLQWEDFVLEGVKAQVDLVLTDVRRAVDLQGKIIFQNGLLQGPSTADIVIDNGVLGLASLKAEMNYYVKARAEVDKTKISLVLKGVGQKYDLQLKSEPEYSSQRLLLMLATNRSWKNVETDLQNGNLSVNLLKNVLGYFLFADKINWLEEKFGTMDLTIINKPNVKGVGVTKSLLRNWQGRYEVEQTTQDNQIVDTTHKIGGEYQVNREFSIDFERKTIVYPQAVNDLKSEIPPANQLMLKYKKNF